MSPLAAGQPLNERFTLVRRLGAGGSAEVWLVHDRELDARFVAKVLPAGTPEDRVALLQRECSIARRLVHPNIVRVHEFHRGGDRAFLVLDLVEGGDSGSLRGAAPLEIVRAAIPVAEALHHAHRQGIVHRDVKVANVLLDASGTPRLGDFGIAGTVDTGDSDASPAGGGTRHAVSPQQLAGEDPAPSDDVYALGVLLYEWVTGHPPFWPDVTPERIRSEVPPPLASTHPVPARLDALVGSMLAKSPADRPTTMADVAATLRAIESDLVPAHGPASAGGNNGVLLTPPPRVEPIRPTVPARHGAGAGGDRPGTVIGARRWLGVAAIVVLGAALIVVFVFLPRWAERIRRGGSGDPGSGAATNAAVPTDDEPAIPGSPPGPAVEGARERMRADDALERATGLRDALERRGAEVWGGEDWTDALGRISTGDGRLAEGRYSEAAGEYETAVDLLEAIDVRAAQVVDQALRDGQAALAAGDAGSASAAFALAGTVDPGNEAAAAGAARGAVLDEVLALLADGRRRERGGDLVGAEVSYRRAVELDPASADATTGLARVRERARDEAFTRVMAEGLAALDRGDPAAAREAFQHAEAVIPGSPEVAEGLARVEALEDLGTVAGIRRQAARLESEERWREAAELYAAAIEVDPALQFARDGRERCLDRAALRESLAFHLDHPDRLSTEQVHREASLLLGRARAVEPAGPVHREQIARLERLLEEAVVPVVVRLVSDGLTEVTVYRVGRLGTFESHELELRPGTYTVVGTRRGYRDVRHRLVVTPRNEPDPLVVRCEEAI